MTYPQQGYGQGAPAGAQGTAGGWSQPAPQSSPQPYGYAQQYPYAQAPAPRRRPGIDPRITYTGALATALGVAGFFFGFGALGDEGGEAISLFEAGMVLYPLLLLLGGLTALAAVWTRNTFGLAVAIIVPLATSMTMLANLQGVGDFSVIGWGYWMIFSLGWVMAALSLSTLLLALGRIGAPRQPGYARGAQQPVYPQQMTGYPYPAPAQQTAPAPGAEETVSPDRAGEQWNPQTGAQNPPTQTLPAQTPQNSAPQSPTPQDPASQEPSQQPQPPQQPPAGY